MEILEKGEPAIIFLAILLGLGLSNIPLLTANSGSLITLFLIKVVSSLCLANTFPNSAKSSNPKMINDLFT